MVDYESTSRWPTQTTPPRTPTSPSTPSLLPTKEPAPSQERHQQEFPSDLIALLRQHSLFQRTNNEAFLTKLASGMHLRIYNPRDIIITKGEASKAMFFLLRGQVEVCSADFERIYATLPQGSCFGEIGILYSIPRTATVVASLKCTVAALTSEQVHALLPLFPDVEKIIRFEAEERLALLSKSTEDQHQHHLYLQQHHNHLQRQQQQQQPQQQQLSHAPLSVSPPPLSPTLKGEQPSNCDRPRRTSVQYTVESFSKTGIRNHLEKIPFFFGCSQDFLHLICLSIQPRNYDGNTVIFNQGDQGDEMYFIVDGYVDITIEGKGYGRLGPGGYFGDTSVLLHVLRAATVKTVTDVELYVLNRVNLQQVCDLFPETGSRLKTLTENKLQDVYQGKLGELPGIHLTEDNTIDPQSVCRTTCDQDPTLPMTPTTQLMKKETKKRRASIAVWNDPVLAEMARRTTTPSKPRDDKYKEDENMELAIEIELPPSPIGATPHTPPEEESDKFRLTTIEEKETGDRFTALHQSIMRRIMSFLDYSTLVQLMRLNKIMRTNFTNGQLLQHIDLSTTHKKVTDDTFSYLMPSIRRRLRSLSLSQCFHLTDIGFRSLFAEDENDTSDDHHHHRKQDSAQEQQETQLTVPPIQARPLQYLHTLDLNSCWLLTDQSLQLLGERCPQLARLDLSNCRKVTNGGMYRFLEAKRLHRHAVGLSWLSLSYCKNLNDVTMQHLAEYASDSLTYLNLQRCTKITDHGFVAWRATTFSQLRTLLLMDCSFLTDRSMQLLITAAPGLERLSLSFCCSLSDSTMVHLAQLGNLTDLDVSFCGAAVSDMSLKSLVHHQPLSVSVALSPSSSSTSSTSSSRLQLYQTTSPHATNTDARRQQQHQQRSPPLKRLNIRGCVRVTGEGLLSSLAALQSQGCRLSVLNITQCPYVSSETRNKIWDLDLVNRLVT